ncbi:hypothetical protein [Acidovorax sp. A1169]|uniref:hypothetical protein n=1 Tax=Acidovorax sp. A1169 TaxID=3059524 RepID=UPI0027379FB6|nr:hypothetical protein [Acidovorax sp. A1169]MDP4076240.1 hypothetical protein [Acidovorax sp. A1169]
MGLTAAVGSAAAATVVSAVASVAFQVTGINDKVNKAASKVFGEDMVKVINIAGAVYGAVNGGFDFGSGAEGAAGLTEAGGALSTKAMLDGTNAFGANSAAGAFDLADGVGALTTGDFSGTTDSLGNSTYSPGDSFNLTEMAKTTPDGVGIAASTPDASQGMDLMKGTQTTGTDTKALVDAAKTGQSTGAARDITAAPADQSMATKPAAAASDAGSAKASGNVETKPLTTTKPPTTAATKPGSFFDKLLNSEKGMGAVVQGVGGALSSAAQGKSQKEALDFAKRKYHSVSGVRVS